MRVTHALLGACGVVAFGTAAQAGTILDFMPHTASPTTPEIEFDGFSLEEGPGAIYDPDKGQEGLQVEVPVVIPGAAAMGGVSDTDSTTFVNVSMDLQGFNAVDFVTDSVFGMPSFAVEVGGPVAGAPAPSITFTLKDDTVLLKAEVTDSTVVAGLLGSNAAGWLSQNSEVVYTDGILMPFITDPNGEFSLSLLIPTGSPEYSISRINQGLASFDANLDGQFNTNAFIPEPASLALLGLGGLALIRRR